MTSHCTHIKNHSQPAIPCPASFPSHLPPDVVGCIICNDSYQELVPGEKALEALRQLRAGVYTPLKNRLVLWSLEQPHAPEPSLLIRGCPEKHMAGASAPYQSQKVCVCVRVCGISTRLQYNPWGHYLTSVRMRQNTLFNTHTHTHTDTLLLKMV